VTAQTTDVTDPRRVVGTHDVLFITLDTLRYDVAAAALSEGRTPNFARLVGPKGWDLRHSPATFTYAAHHAFFAGFLPTPARPGPHPRLLAARFVGSETTTDRTIVFETPDIISGFRAAGYHTVCIGGVGFFNKQTALGSVLPALFDESHWAANLGVTDPRSTEHQVALACARLTALHVDQRVFLFLNISAIHQPNCIFTPDAKRDTADTMAAALVYVDQHIPKLIETMCARAPVLAIVCADHGTAYGEGGYSGHRLAHPHVWNVPYAERMVPHNFSFAEALP
jgi:Sulfatase